MPTLPDRGVTVNRLRIRCRMDPVTARLRAGWLLDESALQPPGLPPSAILCIRRLKDPRPGTIALDAAQLPPRAWRDLVAASIAALARRAERPARGDAAGDADAVMFADRAELLACLAAEWCAGRLASRWWARELLKDLGDGRGILPAWLEQPVHIAAAFDELAQRGAAAAFVERLSASDTRALLDAIVVHHGLGRLASAIEPLNRGDRTPIDATDDARGAAMRSDGRAATIDATRRAPWDDYVPESAPRTLRADRRCLLGIALTTRRAPAVARSARFAEDVQQWCTTVAGARAAAAFSDDTAPAELNDRAQSDRRGGVAHVPEADDKRASEPNTVRERSTRPARTTSLSDRDADANDGPQPTVPSTSRVASAGETTSARSAEYAHSLPRLAGDPRASALRSEEPSQRAAARAGPSPSSIACSTSPLAAPDSVHQDVRSANVAPCVARIYPQSIDTQLGGVFYLLNVAIGLGIYGDFTRPMQPGLELSIWDFLTLAARRLTSPRFKDDGLWALLADLAGRRAEDDVVMAKEMTRRAAPSIRWLMPSVRARLARTVGDIGRRRAGALLCVHRATILTSPTHVDVMFSLAELPIAIRVSGLDRNPGWIPAADRVIAFHYD